MPQRPAKAKVLTNEEIYLREISAYPTLSREEERVKGMHIRMLLDEQNRAVTMLPRTLAELVELRGPDAALDAARVKTAAAFELEGSKPSYRRQLEANSALIGKLSDRLGPAELERARESAAEFFGRAQQLFGAIKEKSGLPADADGKIARELGSAAGLRRLRESAPEELEKLSAMSRSAQLPLGYLQEAAAKYMDLESQANSAVKDFMNSNLRLVVKVAKKYFGRGMDFLDVVQEGNMGLRKAVLNYEPDVSKFSTYGWRLIEQSITAALRGKSRTIRIPPSTQERRAKLERAATELGEELGRPAESAEIAERTGLSVRVVEKNLVKSPRIPRAYSLETLTSVNSERAESELFADHKGRDPMAAADTNQSIEALQAAMEKLDPKEKLVLELRYREKYGLKEVGEVLGVSRQRALQIQDRAEAKLRARLARVFDAE